MNVLVDAHVHLDFYDDENRIRQEIETHQIYSLFMTHIPELYETYYLASEKYRSRYIKLAIGYHPILINEYPFNERLFLRLLHTTNVVGEIGLDYTVARTETSRKKQRDVFSSICAHAKNHILSIHSRNAEDDILDILEQAGCKKAIFHWYTGKETSIPRILDNGYYFSINPMMLNTPKGRNILKQIPADRILVESDGPFSRINGKLVEPESMRIVYNKLAEFLDMEALDILVQTNWKRLIQDKNTI